MKIGIIGAGYVGTVMTDHLLSVGHRVTVLDKFIYGHNQCVLPYLGREGYKFVYGDLRDPKALSSALSDASNVILLAGLVGDPITKKYPETSAEINEKGVINCIDSLNGVGLKKLIFVSTCSNYGLLSENDLASEETDLKPLSLYAKAKVDAEKYLLGLNGDYATKIAKPYLLSGAVAL